MHRTLIRASKPPTGWVAGAAETAFPGPEQPYVVDRVWWWHGGMVGRHIPLPLLLLPVMEGRRPDDGRRHAVGPEERFCAFHG